MLLTSLQRVRCLAARRQLVVPPSCISEVRRWSSTVSHDPLRVLFCGADAFSIASLRALNDIRLKHPEKVASIDVVCRPGKRVGRGLKHIRELPIKEVAVDELKLPLHQIDTFTRWSPPQPGGQSINLVVAVSFGLFVPPRVLNAAKYGGLNVHPSMLPDLRGSAPLHHALLQHDNTIGVTLQTLDLKHFDHGAIVDQTPAPGITMPDLGDSPVAELASFIAPFGAELLRNSIMSGSFVHEHSVPRLDEDNKEPRHAPKTTQEDRHIQWDSWHVKDFLIRDRVLGRLWDTHASKYLLHLDPDTVSSPRVVYAGWEEVSNHEDIGPYKYLAPNSSQEPTVGIPFVGINDLEKRLVFKGADGYLAPKELTIEGKAKVPSSKLWNNIALQVGESRKVPETNSDPTSHTRTRPRSPQHPSKTGTQNRTLSTSTHVRTSRISNTTVPPAPEICWNKWTAATYLKSTTSHSSEPILSHLAAPQSQRSHPLTVTFHNWTDTTIPYSKLIYRSSEIFTCVPEHTPFRLGAPIFVSKDPLKRVMFWVWGNEQQTHVRIVSPEAVEIEGMGLVQGRDLFAAFMGTDGKGGGARVVTMEELNRFHMRKWSRRGGGVLAKGVEIDVV